MYLINGQLHAEYNLDDALQQLREQLPEQLSKPLQISSVLDAVATFASRLNDAEIPVLDDDQRQALIEFCQPETLRHKLQRELGPHADSLRRLDYRPPRFERWCPLGLVVHITPGNAPLLAFCAVIESLLAGNINWLRPSSQDQGLTARLLEALVQCDATGQLRGHIAVLPAAVTQIGQLCQWANGVSAWGGEQALRSIREQIPPGCRWIEWGHRVSFIYLTPESATPGALDAVVDEVCRLDQQACSSPQWLLVDSDDPDVLRAIGIGLAAAFSRRNAHWPALTPTVQEACDITTQTQMARLTHAFCAQTGQVWSAAGWRVIWTHDRQFAPSPLFRSLLLKPLPRDLLSATLLPWRNVLQSCSVICAEQELAGLVRTLLAAGVTRVAPVNAIHDGYAGEPHDGVYALQRLSRRVSVSLPADSLPLHATLDAAPVHSVPNDQPIMSKEHFVTQPINATAQLYFRSGGSSGTPALAGFSYHDFQRQMRATADALFAAGLEPQRDRVMNLFFAGNLYGGFYSFAKALELLDVTHLPMGAPSDDDYSEIARLIIEQGVTVLIGMPSTLHRLFLDHQQALSDYGAIEKVFLGGEHLNPQSRQLMEACGVKRIRSAIYGSVDAGPLGHTCEASGDGVFHLMSDIQQLEIVAFDRDEPVRGDDIGRLLFTSTAREAQNVVRYDIGDSGRWLPGACACGLASPRFELLQRHGRLLRVGSDFICLAELSRHLQTPFQLVVEHAADGVECLLFRSECAPEDARQRLLNYPTLATLVNTGLLRLEVQLCPPDKFTRNKHSGKTPSVIDTRR